MTSERWAGFTDEDIERIKCHPTASKSCPDQMCDTEGFKNTSKKRGQMKNKNMTVKSVQKECSKDFDEVNSTCSESKTGEISPIISEKVVPKICNEDYTIMKNEDHCTCNNIKFDENQRSISPTQSIPVRDAADEIYEGYNEETNLSSTNLPPLEVFEMRQKRIEAENARRRALISKAINDKRLQTHAEAIKLAKINHELNRIDSSLSSDVSILRNYIERASIEFSEAEKRYLKAEKEFVEAKLFLFEKMQRKEMLTEHLCAIIEQNENRKADKLIELMKQLEMEVIVDDNEMNGHEPILPSLCSLSDESYQSCQTLKPNVSKENLEEKISEANHKAESEVMHTDTKTEESISSTSSCVDSTSVDGTGSC